jgi:hypothetical protein
VDHVPRVYLSSTFGVLRPVVVGRLGVLHLWMGLESLQVW